MTLAMQPSTIKDMIFHSIDIITGDMIIFLIVMAGVFVIFFYFIMKKGLNMDDKLHDMLSTIFATVFLFFLLIMSSNGVLQAFIDSILS